MVDFFFVLSGFVIALTYLEKITNWSTLLSFQKKRFLRLYPLHLIMLIIFTGIEISKYIVEIKYGLIANNQAFSKNDLSSFLANFFLIHNWTISSLTFNQPSWSISSEFFTYVLFAGLVLLSRNNLKLFSLILLINIIICWIILNQLGMKEDNIGGPVRCLYSFSIGVIIFQLYENFKNKFYLSSSYISSIVILSIIIIIIKFGTKGTENVELIPFLFGVMILSLVLTNQNTIIHQYLSKRWLVYLGTISYGIYMIHSAVWWLIKQFLRFVIKLPTETDSQGVTKIVFDNFLISNLISLGGILLVIILAHFSYEFIEKRFNFIRGKLKF